MKKLILLLSLINLPAHASDFCVGALSGVNYGIHHYIVQCESGEAYEYLNKFVPTKKRQKKLKKKVFADLKADSLNYFTSVKGLDFFMTEPNEADTNADYCFVLSNTYRPDRDKLNCTNDDIDGISASPAQLQKLLTSNDFSQYKVFTKVEFFNYMPKGSYVTIYKRSN